MVDNACLAINSLLFHLHQTTFQFVAFPLDSTHQLCLIKLSFTFIEWHIPLTSQTTFD